MKLNPQQARNILDELEESYQYHVNTGGFSEPTRVRASDKLETGCVAVNTPVVAVAEAPFGGIKQTGYGREGGSMAIKDYLNIKYTHLGIKG